MSDAYSQDPNDAYWGPMGRMGQPNVEGLPPPQPRPLPPMPPPGPMGGGGGPPLPPGPNLSQPGMPPGIPMPPPMQGGGKGFGDDPFNQALTQSATATQMFSPSAPGIGAPKGPMPPPVGGGGGPPPPAGPPMPPPGPVMPNPSAGGGGVPFGPSTDYRSAMGIAPTDADRVKSAMGGLGKGLTAAAGSSNKAGAVFSRGAGGAITGQIAEGDAQDKTNAALAQQYFNNTSTAFKDFQQQRSTDSLEVYRQAMAAKANDLIARGGPAARSFLNSPEGKLHVATQEAQAAFDRESKNLQDLKGILPAAEYVKRFDALGPKLKEYQTEAYKKYGVDPNQVQNIETLGYNIPKKFSDIKPGQWYAGKDGTPTKKTPNSSDYQAGDQVQWLNTFDGNKRAEADFPAGALYEKGGKVYRRNDTPPGGQTPTAPAPVQVAQTPQTPQGPQMAQPPMPPQMTPQQRPPMPDPMADREAYFGGAQ